MTSLHAIEVDFLDIFLCLLHGSYVVYGMAYPIESQNHQKTHKLCNKGRVVVIVAVRTRTDSIIQPSVY
eukprot:scaffold961_cov122-Cylindrotheca_fusiformis.AAC.29